MHHQLQGLLAVLFITAAAGCSEVRHFFQEDACLDRGGRWDYQQHQCQQSLVPTQYPVTSQPDGKPWPAMQDVVTRKKLLAHIDQLLPGDSSAVVVGKLGVAPLFYYDADSKNLIQCRHTM